MATTIKGDLAGWATKLKTGVYKEQDKALLDMAKYTRSYAVDRLKPPPPPDTVYGRTDAFTNSVAVGDVVQEGNQRAIYIGTSIKAKGGGKLGPMLEDGTGIYGPKGQRIFPVRAKVLRWTGQANKIFGVPGGKGKTFNIKAKDVYGHYARSIRGMKGWGLFKRVIASSEVKNYIEARTAEMWRIIEAMAKG
jgi:hypothetical protein